MLKKLRAVICALFRHSNVETYCFGYHYCARCEGQLGDSLAGAYRNLKVVGMECDCEKCRENVKRLGFVDKFLTPKPVWLKMPPGYSQRKREQALKEFERLKVQRGELWP